MNQWDQDLGSGEHQPPAPTLHGYTRAEVDAFLADVEHERTELRGAIERARAREARARAAANVHNVMLTMVVESSRELFLARQRAQERAAAIIARGEERAAAIRDGRAPAEPPDAEGSPELVDEAPPRSAPIVAAGDAPGDQVGPGTVIDLRLEPKPADSGPATSLSSPNGWSMPSSPDVAQSDESYLSFLRGALVDTSPLGPRFD